MSKKSKDLRSLDEGDLTKQLAELRDELLNLRFQQATGALENTSRTRLVKREIARILTVLNERAASAASAATS